MPTRRSPSVRRRQVPRHARSVAAATSGHDYFETRLCAADEAIAIAEQVAAGLDDLHARQIFHGGISPDNPLIGDPETSERRDLDLVRICDRICDLGIARGAARGQQWSAQAEVRCARELLGKKLRRQSHQSSSRGRHMRSGSEYSSSRALPGASPPTTFVSRSLRILESDQSQPRRPPFELQGFRCCPARSGIGEELVPAGTGTTR